ncbi:MAG TPA: serine hydrolase domain-containing protein, partial [Ktedonobacterales bacterium]|nr:serine hydrolase domain-containing protein [Ktedonobacterales bacterium]
AELVAQMAATSLQTPPGLVHSYSNEGYAVLGLLVDTLSGMSVEHYLQAYVFDPLEMCDTRIRFADWRAAPNRAWGYTYAEETFTPSSLPQDYTAYAAGGGVSSSAIDIARYLVATLNYAESPLLAGGSLDQMHSVSAPFGDTGWGYGLGWAIGWSNGRKVIEHSGGHPGHTTYMLALPWQKLGIVALANGAVEAIDALAERLMGDLLGSPLYRTERTAPLPFRTRFPQPDRETLASYVGTYEQYEQEENSVVVAAGEGELALTLRYPKQPEQTFAAVAVGRDFFLIRQWARPVYFVRDDQRRVSGLLCNGERFSKREFGQANSD